MKSAPVLTATLLSVIAAAPAYADAFGSVLNAFTIDFATVDNAGNTTDSETGGGAYFSPYGAVSYTYRIGITEVAQAWIDKATNSGMTDVTAGAWTGNAPAANMTWYEAAAFVNWLNTSTGHQAAYNLTFNGSWNMSVWSSGEAWQLGGENLYRHKDAFYFLPSENEWYKSAYHANQGVDGLYWDYATGANDAPLPVGGGSGMGTAVFQGGIVSPASVFLNGGLGPYGTRGQNGNVWEWTESSADGSTNSPSAARVRRGGAWGDAELALRPTGRTVLGPANSGSTIGFRVASVPEPGSALLLAVSGSVLLLRRRRK